MTQLALEIILGITGYCLAMWCLVFIAITWQQRRKDYHVSSGELGLIVLAPLLPLILLIQFFDR